MSWVVEWTTVKWTAVQNYSFYSFYSIHQETRKLKSIKKIPLKFVAKWLSNKRQFTVHKNLGLPVKENTLLYLENIFMIYPVKGHVYLNFAGCLFISEWAVAQSVRQGTAVWIRIPVVSENWKTGGNWLIQSTDAVLNTDREDVPLCKLFCYSKF